MADSSPVTVTLCQPTCNRRVTELAITPGVVDEDARELFLYSQCLPLALSVHEATGWPLWCAEQFLGGDSWDSVHFGVRTPGGSWLDIEGPRASSKVEAWLATYGLPVRLRLLGGPGEWQLAAGLEPSTPVAWWRDEKCCGGAEITAAFTPRLITLAGLGE